MHKINKNCVNYILAIIKNTVVEPAKRAVNKVKNTVQKAVSKVHGGSLAECNYDKNGNLKKFNNFKPREYDYDDLERQLLGWDDMDQQYKYLKTTQTNSEVFLEVTLS